MSPAVRRTRHYIAMQLINFKRLRYYGAVIFLFSFRLMAQVDTSAVSGYVLDPSGRIIPNAAVRIESVARSYVRSARSSVSGYYEFDGLPPAEYRLSVNADAFAPLTTEIGRASCRERE